MPPDRLHRLLTATHAGVPDVELVRRVAEVGDDAAFELLVRRHAAAVWRVCRAVSADHHTAEDAFQATFLALLKKAGSLTTNPAGWLVRVATRAALKTRRRLPVLPDGFDTAAPDAPSPDDSSPLVHAELDRLPDRYRLPVVLCHLHGLTQAEAAARLGWPLGTVATRVKRGCEVLRTRLTRRGVVFTLAAFAAGAVGEPAVASAVRLLDPAAISPSTLRLTTEVLRMLNPNPVRLTVLAACGGLLAATAVGVWPTTSSPIAPPASAAPVPVSDQSPALDEAWDGLLVNDAKRQTRGTVRLAADPRATVAFLKKRLSPVTVDEKSAKKVLTDLDSDDAKTWQAAYRAVQYHDPRLALSVPDIFSQVTTTLGRHRLYQGLRTDSTADSKWVTVETWYTYTNPKEVEWSTQKGWYKLTRRTTADAPPTVARADASLDIPSQPENFFRPHWDRADRGITLLEGFGTDDAVALLKEIAGGHPDATPTKSAKEALARLKK